MNPFIVEDAQSRHQAHLDTADQWRLAQSVRAQSPGLRQRLRVALAMRLIAWGQRLQLTTPLAEQ